MATRNNRGLAALGDVFSGVADQITEARLHQRALDTEERLHTRAREERAVDLADVRTYSEGLTKDQREHEGKIFERNRLAHFHDLLRLEGFNPENFDKPELVQAFLYKRGPEYERNIKELAALQARADELLLKIPAKSEAAADLAAVRTMTVDELSQARERVGIGMRSANEYIGVKESEKGLDYEAAAKAVIRATEKQATAAQKLNDVMAEWDNLAAGNLTDKQKAQALAATEAVEQKLAAKMKGPKKFYELTPIEQAQWKATLAKETQEVQMMAAAQMKPRVEIARRAADQTGIELDKATDNLRNPSGQRYVTALTPATPPAALDTPEKGPPLSDAEAQRRAAQMAVEANAKKVLGSEAVSTASPYQYPAASIGGIGERIMAKDPALTRWTNAPRNILETWITAPASLVRGVASLGQAAFTGEIPEKSPVTALGEWIGGKIAGDPYARPPVKPVLFAKPAEVPVALAPTPVAPIRTDVPVVTPTPFSAYDTQAEREREHAILTNFPYSPEAQAIRSKMGRPPLENARVFSGP